MIHGEMVLMSFLIILGSTISLADNRMQTNSKLGKCYMAEEGTRTKLANLRSENYRNGKNSSMEYMQTEMKLNEAIKKCDDLAKDRKEAASRKIQALNAQISQMEKDCNKEKEKVQLLLDDVERTMRNHVSDQKKHAFYWDDGGDQELNRLRKERTRLSKKLDEIEESFRKEKEQKVQEINTISAEVD